MWHAAEGLVIKSGLSVHDRMRLEEAWTLRMVSQEGILRNGGPDTAGVALAGVAHNILGDLPGGPYKLDVYRRFAWNRSWESYIDEAGVKLTATDGSEGPYYAPFCSLDAEDEALPYEGIEQEFADFIGSTAVSNYTWAYLRGVYLNADSTALVFPASPALR